MKYFFFFFAFVCKRHSTCKQRTEFVFYLKSRFIRSKEKDRGHERAKETNSRFQSCAHTIADELKREMAKSGGKTETNEWQKKNACAFDRRILSFRWFSSAQKRTASCCLLVVHMIIFNVIADWVLLKEINFCVLLVSRAHYNIPIDDHSIRPNHCRRRRFYLFWILIEMRVRFAFVCVMRFRLIFGLFVSRFVPSFVFCVIDSKCAHKPIEMTLIFMCMVNEFMFGLWSLECFGGRGDCNLLLRSST